MHVRFGGEPARNLPWRRGKARGRLSHYDSAEGLLTAVILLLAEFLPPKEIEGQLRERRHIVSVFKLVQDLLEPSKVKGKSCFQVLMGRLPSEHKARWFSGAALNTSELSTVLSRLNAFPDTELEQTICFDSPLDAETFASRKSAIFLILPEEDQTKNFMAGPDDPEPEPGAVLCSGRERWQAEEPGGAVL